ncbi:hypothetical protein L1987_50902 [Smallanthus sonchifolius]|uniref:Uncharacterized protein n=1 Tax=Smallanthus sonchifolius TaxID=185202 RepID=A0ACB9ENS1_9ASTR|nr:hypothetical protein L1987_50902 [Smallanthus sonchifolius]
MNAEQCIVGDLRPPFVPTPNKKKKSHRHQNYSNTAMINEETMEHSSTSKEDSVGHGEVVNAQTKSIHASLSKEHSDDQLKVSSAGKVEILPHDHWKKFSFNDNDLKNFTREMRLGGGQFGEVFKGEFGMLRIAIKRFHHYKIQHQKFVDMTFLSKFGHPNVVKILGYCFEDEKLFLVYKFMENGSLDSHLFTKDKIPLSWKTRVQIAIGIANALLFLHRTQYQVDSFSIRIHQILLDKIDDEGLLKMEYITGGGSTETICVWIGKGGLLKAKQIKRDKEEHGSPKLLCGRAALERSLDEDKCSLAKWAHESIEEGKVYDIIDFNIKSQISPKCLKVFVKIADRCLSSESKKRPTMAEILVDLEHSLTLQNKYDSRIKPGGAGILSIARMIKWPFISPELDAAQSVRKPSTINEDASEYSSSSSKEDRFNYVPEEHNRDDLKKFSFDELRNATRDFNGDMRLGGGEFGEVFEGWMDTNTSSDGQLRIAIKRFHHSKIKHHLQEEDWAFTKDTWMQFVDMTFLNEFNHPNLVKVLGYCLENRKIFLVYEFMENGSLDSHLFTQDKIPLPWKTRLQIAIGVAEALSFLQRTQNQVHNRHIRLRHILLDKNFNAKISDFESAKLVYGELYKEKIIDPLYYYSRNNSEGIMHAFGVVLIHILTGELSSKIGIAKLRETNLTEEERLRRTLDPRLPNVDDTTIKEAMKLADVALCCIDNPVSFTLKKAWDALRQLYTC